MAIIRISMCHKDSMSLEIDDARYTGYYMPYANPALQDSDTTTLEIDNETGRIIGWEPIQIKDDRIVCKSVLTGDEWLSEPLRK